MNIGFQRLIKDTEMLNCRNLVVVGSHWLHNSAMFGKRHDKSAILKVEL